VAVDVMRELGLTSADVRARVSDRRLLNGVLEALGVAAEQLSAVYGVADKLARQPRAASEEQLAAAGLAPALAGRVLALADGVTFDALRAEFGAAPAAREAIERFGRYLGHCEALGIGDWVTLDLSIVRGLAYYTGIVFELFDAKGELRAICGGGRYDDLLKALGGADLPALGFGMGDVVLGELLTERGLWPSAVQEPVDFHVVAGNGAVSRPYAEVLRLASALRGAGFSVHHGMNEERYKSQATRNQVDGARKAGASAVVYFREDGAVEAMSLLGKMTGAATHAVDAGDALSGQAQAMQGLRHWLQTQRTR
jgi:histidyl-tRNA synthetase